MIINHQTKLGRKRIISSEDIVETYFDCIILHCDLSFEDSNPIILHNTPASDGVSPDQVSKLEFYAQSTSVIISGETHFVIIYYFLKVYMC